MSKPLSSEFYSLVAALFTIVAVVFFCLACLSYFTSDEVITRENQCTNFMQNISGNQSISTVASTTCAFGAIFPQEQYPPRLPNPQINVTVKTIHFLWLGDCKVMASTGEVYHSAEDQICMAQPGENLAVYQYRTRDNTVTDLIQMGA